MTQIPANNAIRDEILRISALDDGGMAAEARLGVRLHVTRAPSLAVPILSRPVLHLPFQGSKRVVVASREIDYGAGDLLVFGAHLPALVEVTLATAEEPYVALEIPLDRHLLSSLVAEMGCHESSDGHTMALASVPESVLEPVQRLLFLASDPQAANMLKQNVKREILFRLLVSPVGDMLRALLQLDSALNRIDTVAEWMQDHLDAVVRVDDLASRANMSAGSFHRHFRRVMGTSPGEYHKTVRLHEARRQIVTNSGTLSQISSRLGFLSPSQFSRDYKRVFGVPPSKDFVPSRTS